jgi:hypothetical protein
MRSLTRRTLLALAICAVLPWGVGRLEPAGPISFAAEIERLSEPEGVFDTDNLISNERGYLDVIPDLVSRGVRGGAYIGVGPDQNFTYIARVRPAIAYIIDVRRDNLLLHLLFKALFAVSRDRAEYLSLLTGRALPTPSERWSQASLDDLVAHIDGTTAQADQSRLSQMLEGSIRSFGVPLAQSDMETIARFHRAFVRAGLGLKFNSFGRPPSHYYPTLRDLLLARDATGHQWNYLASDEDFQFVRRLQLRDAIIPVVGNVNGGHALSAIGESIVERRHRVTAFYISNVESYLRRDGTFPLFVSNLKRLPHDQKTVMIRSIFNGGGSVSLVQAMDEMLARTGALVR